MVLLVNELWINASVILITNKITFNKTDCQIVLITFNLKLFVRFCLLFQSVTS